ncbi:MAG TPA: TlpA disulfide reductase family protein [Eubacteriales bacterium]|nr:TlpA disulfide reductase family protein [Eubacteriales bacterium]
MQKKTGMKTALIVLSVLMAAVLLGACTGVQADTAQADAAQTETSEATAADAAEETAAADESGLSFSLTTITGDTVDDSIVSSSKLTMVNYWATWCGPCVSEIPDIQQLSEDYADSGLSVIGVLFGDDDTDGAKEFLSETGVTYPVVLPEGAFLTLGSDIYAIPTTMFFDSDGNQVGDTVVGSKSYEDWAGLVELLLGQVG